MESSTQQEYLLGHDPAELERLEQQARVLAPATTLLLERAGIEHGMRVLDLGTGAGDVAVLVGELVGPDGAVLGVDRSPEALALARARVALRGLANTTFADGDVHDFRHEGFDAVVGRLVLLYTPDPVAVVRHHADQVRPGGIVLTMEYDMPPARSVPACPTVGTAVEWVTETFTRAGLDPALGPKLASIVRRAGLHEPVTLGVQPYLSPTPGSQMLAGIVRTLLPVMEQTGVATAADIDIATLADRLERDLDGSGAVLAPPTLVGTWARVR